MSLKLNSYYWLSTQWSRVERNKQAPDPGFDYYLNKWWCTVPRECVCVCINGLSPDQSVPFGPSGAGGGVLVTSPTSWPAQELRQLWPGRTLLYFFWLKFPKWRDLCVWVMRPSHWAYGLFDALNHCQCPWVGKGLFWGAQRVHVHRRESIHPSTGLVVTLRRLLIARQLRGERVK